MEHQYTNSLINSTSPYLLQHAHNPVDWHPWDEERIKEARKKDKLLIVSIGYAACHWCHVMEHESFESPEVAEVMNNDFICIKVDREERPDVDHYYMTAIHLMGQQGGWPLNVIALPDGRPIWGGTYFPRETWINNIRAVAAFYRQNREKAVEYAQNVQKGIQQVSITPPPEDIIPANSALLDRAVSEWRQKLDYENGGSLGVPKFPMPVNLDFLLHYGAVKRDEKISGFVKNTLQKMARGGIYDQAGGGFARYSVDEKWKVPHFEKMLYDNGQLLSIYSKAYQVFKEEEFKTVVAETAGFLERELMDPSGAFYSSLDADSEGEEGKYYVWKSPELQAILGSEYPLFIAYYQVNSKAFWEEGKNILLRDTSDEDFALKHGLTVEKLMQKVKSWKADILKERSRRVRPGLDDKVLTSWNALVIQGLADAYKSFGTEAFRKLAKRNALFLKDNVMLPEGRLFHSWKYGTASVDGFLEDYALIIQAFIALFEITGEESWLYDAEKLTDYAFRHFFEEEAGLFYFSKKRSKNQTPVNHFQKEDNVIPSANSVMAMNLFHLGHLLGKTGYLDISGKMVHHITPLFVKYPMAFGRWGVLMLKMTGAAYEVAICGKEAEKNFKAMQQEFLPQVTWAFSEKASKVPVLKNRFVRGKTLIYVCQGGSCKLPVENVDEALNMLKE